MILTLIHWLPLLQTKTLTSDSSNDDSTCDEGTDQSSPQETSPSLVRMISNQNTSRLRNKRSGARALTHPNFLERPQSEIVGVGTNNYQQYSEPVKVRYSDTFSGMTGQWLKRLQRSWSSSLSLWEWASHIIPSSTKTSSMGSQLTRMALTWNRTQKSEYVKNSMGLLKLENNNDRRKRSRSYYNCEPWRASKYFLHALVLYEFWNEPKTRHYLFIIYTCTCQACQENYLHVKRMNASYIRFNRGSILKRGQQNKTQISCFDYCFGGKSTDGQVSTSGYQMPWHMGSFVDSIAMTTT